MKINLKEIPRKFFVGLKRNIEIKDLGEVFLNDNEQVTFITEDNKRYDFVKKDWGYYGTPSINKRLKLHNSSKGAKFTKGRKWTLIYKKCYKSKSIAMKNEYLLKKNYKQRLIIKKKFLMKSI